MSITIVRWPLLRAPHGQGLHNVQGSRSKNNRALGIMRPGFIAYCQFFSMFGPRLRGSLSERLSNVMGKYLTLNTINNVHNKLKNCDASTTNLEGGVFLLLLPLVGVTKLAKPDDLSLTQHTGYVEVPSLSIIVNN